MLIDVERTSLNVAIAMAAVLLVVGFIQLWVVMRNKAPESVDSLMSARGSVAVFAGLAIVLLYFLNIYYDTGVYLTTEAGLIIFGLATLFYGISGLILAMKIDGRRRRSALIEGVFFTLFGLLLFYIIFGGAEAVSKALQIVGWIAIFGGASLIGLAFFNRSKEQQAQEAFVKAEGAKKKADTKAREQAEAAEEAKEGAAAAADEKDAQ